MASKRIKGITIEIDGNTKGLDKSLQDVDKRLKTTKDDLKDVNRLLKLDPKNTTVESMEIIYELAYVMAKQGDKSLDLSFDEWLDSFEVFPIEQIANETLMLWQKSNTGLSTPKKQ